MARTKQNGRRMQRVLIILLATACILMVFALIMQRNKNERKRANLQAETDGLIKKISPVETGIDNLQGDQQL